MRASPTNPAPTLEQRFRTVHATTYLDLVRFAERRVPRDDAEDVVSTTFMTAWRRVAEMPEDARPWLFGIARNLIRNTARGTARRRDLDVAVAGTSATSSSDPTVMVGNRLDLVRAWSRLSPRDRETLALVAFDDLSAQQAAVVLGCGRSTFTMRLTRARRRLRDALDHESSPTLTAAPTPFTTETTSWTHA